MVKRIPLVLFFWTCISTLSPTALSSLPALLHINSRKSTNQERLAHQQNENITEARQSAGGGAIFTEVAQLVK
jgi:hypothetical protein